jgi:drug/metabolite transporter (DMT)-like permease
MNIIDFINNNSTVFLIIGMLCTGSFNTILTKLQDSVCVDKCDTDKPVYFEQPMIQTLNMFIGEIFCLFWLLFYKSNNGYIPILSEGTEQNEEYIERKSTVFSKLLLFFPAACDSLSSTLMNIGLMFTSASIFQMLRGSIVIFTGVISTLFLNARYTLHQWLALFIIFSGITIVGTSHLNAEQNTVAGILLIISAQLFSSSQYVLEEKIMIQYNVDPLIAVSLEGVFGLVIMSIITVLFQITGIIDTITGVHQLVQYPSLYLPSLGIIISISLFNWFGLCITKNISSTSRATIDICRTLIIWIISLSLQWETFKWLQVAGFTIMICGIFIFNKKEYLST